MELPDIDFTLIDELMLEKNTRKTKHIIRRLALSDI